VSLIHAMTEQQDAARVGGKAASLMRLAAHGFDVPAFAVVEPGVFANAASERAMQAELVIKLASIGPGPYAARSSAREEDGATASHAGQFLSLLDLPADELPEAVRRVYASGQEQSVANYRHSRGLDGEGGAPAIVVQQMVRARCAGVAFSADPVSGRRDVIMISAIAGLGDRLVGGEEDGQRYLLARASAAVLEQPTIDPVLSAADLAALHDLALSVETACGAPQDMEWAFEGDRLFLLQARPITTALRPLPIADDTLTVLDNSNIVESYPGLVSPLTFSFAQYAYARVYRSFVAIAGIPGSVVRDNAAVFDNLLSRVHGRVYYNLGNWYRALSLLPGFASNRANMELMMGVGSPLPDELVATMAVPSAGGSRLLGMLRVAWRLLYEALRLKRTTRAFYARVEFALAKSASALDTMPLTALAAEYRRIESDLLDQWDAPLINDFLCMIAFGASRKMMERWAGAPGLALHSDVMIGQGDIVSAEPAQRIRAMGRMLASDEALRRALAEGRDDGLAANSELSAAVKSYLDKFADRCAEELKLESVTLDRDPAPLYRAIAAASMMDADARPVRDDTDKALRQMFARHPLRRFLADWALRLAKHRVRDRENLRFERTRIFGRGRRLFRAIGTQLYAGGLLDHPDDIFLLTVPEVLGAIEGFAATRDLAGLAQLRKAEHDTADLGERVLVRGAVTAGIGASVSTVATVRDAATERQGTGCSAGMVTAVARVISDPRTQSIGRGEILVARHTDPGWIALFTNAAAIVVERGSPLSHSAIVARELGIPCVVALKGAMAWIADGEIIAVNGSSGMVRRLT
jgi:pyruvate,water dikinase